MHSRWWDFGGDTVIRTDQYVLAERLEYFSCCDWLLNMMLDTCVSLRIDNPSKAGYSRAFLSLLRTGR
jgi:hypothetical protein